ncbi:MAG: hypothetical protein GYA15_00985 [Leptolinea sp.]|nr:hypothetical protein [Leptolinea sp.]
MIKDPTPSPTIIFQSAKLGGLAHILDELDWAESLLKEGAEPGRIFGISGGNLTALAFGLALAARRSPQVWGKAGNALADFRALLRGSRGWQIRTLKCNPKYGFHSLNPLRGRLAALLRSYTGRDGWQVSDLGLPLYLCSLDSDALFHMYGPPDDSLQCEYPFIHIPPPQDAPLLDALIAGLSTLLSTDSQMVNGDWRFDCRPAVVDAGAIIADLQTADPRPILRSRPHNGLRRWKLNWFTSSFVMHSYHEQNQPLLAAHYLDLLARHASLKDQLEKKAAPKQTGKYRAPRIIHVDLPYIGSTEAATNMHQSVENRVELTARFQKILHGQLDTFPFDWPANIIYGAGGFSGILAGMVTTRAVDEGFARGGGEIRQIYGVSAGVLNGFFHAVQVAAAHHPDLYKPAALHALDDLENLMEHLERRKFIAYNKNPLKLWKGFGNLGPLEVFLMDRLAAYIGSAHPADITFDDIALPLTVCASRTDGYPEYFGMTRPERSFVWQGRTWEVKSAPVVKAVLAGWSMNTYILPTVINGQEYTDGGGSFYDHGLMVACLDPELTNLLNIHLDEPEGNSYNLPSHMNLMNILFDTHNLTFPEERRRMRAITNLLYEDYALRGQAEAQGLEIPSDFRRNWTIEYSKAVEL